MSTYNFQIIYKPIVDMYQKFQINLLEYTENSSKFEKLDSESDKEYAQRIETIVAKIQDTDKETMNAIKKLLEISLKKERPRVSGCPEFYKTTENLAIILKLLHELKDSKYADTDLEKLLERVIFFFFSYTIQICDKIYATHKIQHETENNEKPA